MLRFNKPGVACGLVPDTAAGHKDEDTYDRHAGNLYRQALFTLDDTEMAEQVVSDVIVEECTRPAGAVSGQDAGRRLAISAYQRCMGLAGGIGVWSSDGPEGRRRRLRRSGRAERPRARRARAGGLWRSGVPDG
jgi:hypothetical protein